MAWKPRYDDPFWISRTSQMWDAAYKRHDGKLEIRAKDEQWTLLWRFGSWLVGFVVRALSGFTQPAPDYYGQYCVVIGRTIWTPSNATFDSRSAQSKHGLLSHEIDHMDYAYFGDSSLQDAHPDDPLPRQRGFFARWWHQIKYTISSAHRADVEERGYRRTIHAGVLGEMSANDTIDDAWAEYTARTHDYYRALFTGSTYGYMRSKEAFAAWWQSMREDVRDNWAGKKKRTGLFSAALGEPVIPRVEI